MVYKIEEIKEKAILLAEKYNLGKMSLFGSYARGEADEDSDIDFLIDTRGSMGMFKYASLLSNLEEEFQCHVDVITTECSNNKLLEEILNEEIVLYER